MQDALMAIQVLDESILEFVNQLVGISPIVDRLIEIIAEWVVYAVPIVLLVAWFWSRYSGKLTDYTMRRVELVELTLAGLLAWRGFSRIIKFFYFRERPAVAGQDIKEVFFQRPDESFPSDHAALLFALAIYCYILGWQRIAQVMMVIAIAVSTARIIPGTHWFSDILAGMLIGVFSAYVILWLRAPLDRYVIRPLVTFVSKLGL